MKLTRSPHETYCLSSVSYTYELQFNELLTVLCTHDDGDLIVYTTDESGNNEYHDEDDMKFWLGAVLFWYDADNHCEWNVNQMDAVVRLAMHMRVVPELSDIEQYAVPIQDEFYSYDEMMKRLNERNFLERL